jgi:RNA polymerase sigma factor (sigma-70 family)
VVNREVTAWLFGVLRNLVMWRFKERTLIHAVGEYGALEPRDPTPNISEEMLNRELEVTAEACLDTLSPDQRAAFVLYASGQSLKEIAERLGRPVTTVTNWVYRARERMQACIRSRSSCRPEQS